MSCDGSATRRATVEVRNNPISGSKPAVNEEQKDQSPVTSTATNGDWPRRANGTPDFERMTSKQRQAFGADRLKRKFG